MASDVFFPRINGVSTSIETFRRCLAGEGIEVRLVAPSYGDEAPADWIVRVPGRQVPGDPEDRLVRWRAMHAAVTEAAHDCDLLHVQTPFVAHYAGLKAARRLRRPVLATYHTLFEEYLGHYAPFLPAALLRAQARAWSRRQCNALDALVVPSRAMQERLGEYGVQVPMHVLPTGIPLDRFAAGDRAAFRARHGIAPERPVALFVGRVAHEKNIGFLLEAMKIVSRRVPQALLLVTGEGPAMPDLRRQAKALGLGARVCFLGYLDRASELPDCYAAADVFVFASRTETQGLVLLEAMAAGLPVIALAEMGTRDILGPRRGAIVPPDDVDAFGRALCDYFERREVWPALADEARRYAAEWSDSALAARLAGLYRQLVNEHHKENNGKSAQG